MAKMGLSLESKRCIACNCTRASAKARGSEGVGELFYIQQIF
jgi:hypothetical protein